VAGSSVQSVLEPFANITGTQHMTAAEILREYPDKYTDYVKISCFRHPYNRLISHYFRRFEYGQYKKTLKRWLREISPKVNTFHHVNIKGRVDVDQWILFEDLERTLFKVLDYFGIDHPKTMPHLKPSKFTGDYMDYLNDRDVEVIHDRFLDEIKLAEKLGYNLNA
jgi:hypothetical protein